MGEELMDGEEIWDERWNDLQRGEKLVVMRYVDGRWLATELNILVNRWDVIGKRWWWKENGRHLGRTIGR